SVSPPGDLALLAHLELVWLVRNLRTKTMKPRCKALLATMFVAALSGCGDQKESPSAAQAASAPEKNSATAAAAPTHKAGDVEANVPEITAPLIFNHKVNETAQTKGMVAKFSADPGAHAQAATLLAKLDNRQLPANLEAARAKTRSIAADLKNWQAE